jgi:hypothetical protein
MPSIPNLRPYSVRPGFVDISDQPGLAKHVPPRESTFLKKLIPVLGPIYRTVYASGTSPTKKLSKVLVELATGDGEKIEGKGGDISGDGRFVECKGILRLASSGTGKPEGKSEL